MTMDLSQNEFLLSRSQNLSIFSGLDNTPSVIRWSWECPAPLSTWVDWDWLEQKSQEIHRGKLKTWGENLWVCSFLPYEIHVFFYDFLCKMCWFLNSWTLPNSWIHVCFHRGLRPVWHQPNTPYLHSHCPTPDVQNKLEYNKHFITLSICKSRCKLKLLNGTTHVAT